MRQSIAVRDAFDRLRIRRRRRVHIVVSVPRSRYASSFRSRRAAAPTISLRTLQPGLSSVLGQPLVLDNRGGASSIIGTELAARSAPDGYTLLLITTTYTVNPGSHEEAALRSGQGFCGHLACGIAAEHPRNSSVGAREIGERARRARQKQNDEPHLRLGRQRQLASSVRRVAAARGGHRPHARAVQGLRAPA